MSGKLWYRSSLAMVLGKVRNMRLGLIILKTLEMDSTSPIRGTDPLVSPVITRHLYLSSVCAFLTLPQLIKHRGGGLDDSTNNYRSIQTLCVKGVGGKGGGCII